MGGALTYIENLLRELPVLAAPGEQFSVIVPSSTLRLLGSVAKNDKIKLIPYRFSTTNPLQRLYFDNWTVPLVAREYKADVLFSFTGFGTLLSPLPQILLVHNAAYFCPVFKQKYKEINASLRSTHLRRWISLLSMRTTDVVVFPSSAMHQLVISHCPIAIKKIAIIHHGFSSNSFFQGGVAKPEIAHRMQRWRAEGYRILLNVSHYAIHKNFETLIEALSSLIASRMKIKFVCSLSGRLLTKGSLYAASYDSLLARQLKLGLADSVVHAGHFDYAQLQYLYESADVFVFPSFTESFGLPLVEAMSCGLPIVASDTAVNRELCGAAAIYFDTFDPFSCSSALKRTLLDTSMSTAMKRKAIDRSKDYSWTSCVSSLLNLFRNISV